VAAYRRAQAIDEKAHGPDHPILETEINNLGDVYLGQGRIDLALKQYERGLQLLTKARGAAHPSLARPLLGIGECYLHDGARARAVAPIERALALRLAHPGDPFDLAQTRFDLARAVVDGDRPRARELARAARAAFAALPSRQAETAEVERWLRNDGRE
jgi:tetratricopeptide (TPR) repeat protein